MTTHGTPIATLHNAFRRAERKAEHNNRTFKHRKPTRIKNPAAYEAYIEKQQRLIGGPLLPPKKLSLRGGRPQETRDVAQVGKVITAMASSLDHDSVSASQAETRAAPGSPRPPKHGPGAATAFDGGSRHWSILTKSRGGVVSVVRDLTLDEAKGMHSRLQPEYGQTMRVYETVNGTHTPGPGRQYQDSDIDLIEVFGPPGWDSKEVEGWEDWPKVEMIPLDQHGYRRCPECQLETDAPEGSTVCRESHGNSYYGETDHCPIWVDGETSAEYEAKAGDRQKQRDEEDRRDKERYEHLKKSSRRWWSIA